MKLTNCFEKIPRKDLDRRWRNIFPRKMHRYFENDFRVKDLTSDIRVAYVDESESSIPLEYNFTFCGFDFYGKVLFFSKGKGFDFLRHINTFEHVWSIEQASGDFYIKEWLIGEHSFAR